MANVKAIATGNWSNTAIWDTGALPTASDDVYANGFTVTINQAITVLSIRTTSNTGINAGGGFSMTTAYNCSADVIAGTTTCLTYTANGATWTGNITGPTTFNQYGANNTGTGTINIIGNVIAGTGNGAFGANNNSTGNINITGNVTGGNFNSAYGAVNISTGIINITGNVTGGNTTINFSYGVQNLANGTINITGTVTGGTTSGGTGAINSSVGTLTITGTATGGTASSATGANNASTGTLTVTTATASSTVNVLAVGVNGANTGGLTRVKNIVFGSAGQVPVSGFIKFDNGTGNTATVLKKNATTVALSDPLNIANNVPATNNVRSGIAYNNNTQTGTMIVAPTASVALNVPTDNTVGSAYINASSVWDALTSGINTAGSIGKLIKDNFDTTVSSRLATAGYTAPDNTSISAIKAKTDTLVNTDLTGIDADLITINTGVQKASLLIPHTTNL